MPKVLLCAEGVTEFGRDGKDGVLQVLMRKCVASKELSFVVKTRGDVKDFRLFRKGINKTDRTAIAIAGMAQKESCRHIAYHHDEDNQGFDVMVAQVEAFFSVARKSGMKCVAIIPQHMTESWLLADEKAFEKAFKKGTPKKSALPKWPERTGGKPGTDKYPKRHLELVLEQFNAESNAEIKAELADHVNIDVLVQKCPVSFGRFHSDMQDFIL